RLAELRDRGLIAVEPYATVLGESQSRRETIDRAGRYARCMASARALSATTPSDAIRWVEQAIEIDPNQLEAWQTIVTMLWSQEKDEAAITWCARGTERFGALQAEVERMRAQCFPRAQARIERARKAQLEAETSARLALVRKAIEDHRFEETLALCREILAGAPEHPEALANTAFAFRRLGKLDQAIQIYDQLDRLQPRNTVWSRWATVLRREQLPLSGSPEPAVATEPERPTPHDAIYILPERSWSSFTAEF